MKPKHSFDNRPVLRKPQPKAPREMEAIVDEIVRAASKPDAERSIALRIVVAKAKEELCEAHDEVKARARALAMKVFDDAVIDAISIPGALSPYKGMSVQNVLALLRKKFIEAA